MVLLSRPFLKHILRQFFLRPFFDRTVLLAISSLLVILNSACSVTKTQIPQNLTVASNAVNLGNLGPTSIAANACSTAFEVLALTVDGAAVSVQADAVINLTVGGHATLYSDSSCTTPVTSVTILASQFSAFFYVKDTLAESAYIIATTSSLHASQINFTVTAGALSKTTITGPTSPIGSACNGPYTVTTTDVSGNSISLSSATAIQLLGNGTGQFYSNGSCTLPVTSMQISSGTSSVNFFFKIAAGGTLNFVSQATVNSVALTDGQLSVTVTGSTPTQLLVSGSATATAGGCNAYTVTTNDNLPIPSKVSSATTVHLASMGSGLLYSDAACTLPIVSTVIATGTSSSTFYMKDNLAESFTFNLTSTGLTAASKTVAVSTAPASKLVITGGTASLPGGICTAAFTTQIQDAYNNPITVGSNAAVTLSGQGTGGFYSDSSCVTPLAANTATILSGAHSVLFYFKGNAAESLTLTAATVAIAGVANGTKPIAITVAGITSFVISAIPTPNPAGTVNAMTVTAYNSLGVVMTNYRGTVHFSSDDTAAALPADYTFLAADNGAHTFASGVTFKTVGTKYFKVTDSVITLALGQQLNITVGIGALGYFTVAGVTTPLTAGTTASATVTAYDLYGNLKTDYTGTIVFSSNDTSAILPSNYTFLVSDAGAHTFTNSITLKLSGTRYVKVADQATPTLMGQQTGIIVNTAALSYMTASGISNPTNAGATNSLVVTVYDIFNNVKKDYVGTVVITSTDSAATLPSNYTFLGSDNGTHAFTSAIVLKTAGTQSVSVTDQAATSVVGSESGIVVNAGSAMKLALSGPSATSNIACSTAFTVSSEDTYGNSSNVSSNAVVSLSGGGAGTFYSDPSCATPVASVTITTGTSSKVFYFKDATAANLTLSATSSGMTSATMSLTVANPVLYVTGPEYTAPATCTSAYSVTLADTSHSLLVAPSNLTIGLVATGTAQIFSDAACTAGVSSVTINSGSSSALFYLSDAATELSTITASHSNTSSGLFSASFSAAANTFLTAAGSSHSCFAVNGSVKCVGDNTYGELGNGANVTSYAFVQATGLTSGVTSLAAGPAETCAVVSGGAKCWGQGTSGQIGNGLSVAQNSPTAVSGLSSGVTQIAVGDSHACAVVAGGVKCWGSNSSGQLGNGTTVASNTPVIAIAAASNVTKVSIGKSYSCALFSSGAVSCWGLNSKGQVGDGSGTNQLTPVQIIGAAATDIAAGVGHACAIVGTDVECWGEDNNTYPTTPTIMTNFSGTPAALFSNPAANYTCATLNTGALQCWGNDDAFGQYGIGTLFGMNPSVLATPNQAIGLTSGVLGAAVGASHTCAVTTSGFQCWGNGDSGRTGAGVSTTILSPTATLSF